MNLYKRKTGIQAKNSGKILPLGLVIQRVLEKLKELAIDEIKKRRPAIQNIKYVVTIPAIWEEFQKTIMMEASINAGLIRKEDDKSLFFVLEPEAISYYCLKYKGIDQNLIKEGNYYIICDLGQKTFNIVTHIVGVNKNVNEICPPYRCELGSNEINKLIFEDIIYKIFDCKDFNTFYKKYIERNENCEEEEILFNDWRELEREIDDFKEWTTFQKVNENEYYTISFQLFRDIFNEDTNINFLVDKYNKNCYNDSLKLKILNKMKWRIGFPYKIIYNYIKMQVNRICQIIKNILENNNGINSMILVGSYCNNEILISEIKNQLSNKITYFLQPSKPSLAIIEGAVLFGLNQNKNIQKKNINSKEDKKKRYKIIKELQKGGFGNIFLSYDNKEKREVVIKKIMKKNDKREEERFNREIKAMKEIKCENSVEIYDYYSDDKYYYLVMEKCDGDLFDLLEIKKGFSENEIKNIFLQLNKAFKIMYEKQIIHRDLKPENILIKYTSSKKDDFIVKLGDYGNNRIYDKKKHSTKIGTPEYTAPEILFSGNNNYDPTKCDLWSIGVIIYKLKFNEVPLTILSGNIPGKFSDKNLHDLIMKLIVLEPEKRIEWKNYFTHPFFN